MSVNPTCEKDRYKSFFDHQVGKVNIEVLSWPHKSPSAESMARFGFFFSPTKIKKDQVICTGCQKREHNWGQVKDVLSHHLNKNPVCPLALFHKAWLERDFHTESSIDMSILKQRKPSLTKKVQDAVPARILLNYDWLSHPVFKDPISKKVAKIRKDSFASWPKGKPPELTMANAGFFSTPISFEDDTCVCLYCKLSLEDWNESDDPLAEHKRLSPDCYFFTYDKQKIADKSLELKSAPTSAGTVESLAKITDTETAALEKSSLALKKSSKKRTSSERAANSSKNDSGALIATKSSLLNKRAKKTLTRTASGNSTSKKALLDDTSSDSLGFAANFPEANKENRTSEDYEGLTSFDKPLRKFKTLQKYNSTINQGKSKALKVTKKKTGLLFSSDEEESEKKVKKQKKKKTKKKANASKEESTITADGTNRAMKDKGSDTKNGTHDDKERANDVKSADKHPNTFAHNQESQVQEVQISAVISESTRNNITQSAATKETEEASKEPLAALKVPVASEINGEEDHNMQNQDLPQDSPQDSPQDLPQDSPQDLPQDSPQDNIAEEKQTSKAAQNPAIKSEEMSIYELDEDDLDASSIIEDSAIMSPEKKDPSLYSSSTPIAKLRNLVLPNRSALAQIPNLTKKEDLANNDNNRQNSNGQKYHNEKDNNNNEKSLKEVAELERQDKEPNIPKKNIIDVNVSPLAMASPKVIESTRIDYRNYSLNPANLDDSDYDVSISVYEKMDNNLAKIDTPIKESAPIQPSALSTPLFNPSAEGTNDQMFSARESTPITPSHNGEIQLRNIDSVPQWNPKTRQDVADQYDDIRKANEFLKDISNLDHQLSEDIDGVLTTFISQVPEKELNMTISQWIEFQTEQCKKLLRLKCDAMVQQFEQEGERAIEFIMKM